MRKFLAAAVLAVATIGVAAAPAAHADPPYNTTWNGNVCVRGLKATATLNAAGDGYVLSGPGRARLDSFGVTMPTEVAPGLFFQVASADSKALTTITAQFTKTINLPGGDTRLADGTRYLLPYSIDFASAAQDNGDGGAQIIIERYSVCVALGLDFPPPS